MAYNNSSFFAGIGVAFAAIAVGFAGGALITTDAVQPPNRLERLNSGTTVGAAPPHQQTAASNPQPQNPAQPAAQDAPPPATVATSAPAADPQPSPPATAKSNSKADDKTDVATNAQQSAPVPAPTASNPAPVAKSEDVPPAKSERASSRSADSTKSVLRKRPDDRKFFDDRKFSERRHRQDQDDRRLDEATNVVRQMPRNGPVEVVEQDDMPRYRHPPRHFGLIEEDDSPRVVNAPPPLFGLFGN
jgi:hypothetical protein